MSALDMKEVRKVYRSGDDEVVALDHASLSVGDDEMVALVGPSGSGIARRTRHRSSPAENVSAWRSAAR